MAGWFGKIKAAIKYGGAYDGAMKVSDFDGDEDNADGNQTDGIQGNNLPFNTEGSAVMSVMENQTTKTLEIKIVNPKNLNSVERAARYLAEGQAVLLDFKETNREMRRRCTDFLVGFTFASGGKFTRISDDAYILASKNIDVSADKFRDRYTFEEI